MAWWDVEGGPIKDRTHAWFRGYKAQTGSGRYERLRNRKALPMDVFKEQFYRKARERMEKRLRGQSWDMRLDEHDD